MLLSIIAGITKKKAALKCVSCESQYLGYAPVWQEEIISAAYEVNNFNNFLIAEVTTTNLCQLN